MNLLEKFRQALGRMQSIGDRMMLIQAALFALMLPAIAIEHLVIHGAVLVVSLIAIAWGLLVIWVMTNHKKVWVVKLMSRITGRTAVELIDFEKGTYLTLCNTHPDSHGLVTAPVYWFTGTGKVTLEQDGTVKEGYIEHWLPLDRDKRIQHLLTYGAPY